MSFVFPSEDSIPEKYRIQPIHQKEYLLDGEIRIWEGESQIVKSPIFLNKNGKLEQVVLGSYPNFDEKQSLLALDAAVKAFNHGTGVWPIATTKERIDAVRIFITLMKGKRDQIILLLMWEIGKTEKDATKEFERTIEYLEDTIESLQELETTSSNYIKEGGLIAQIKCSPYGVVLCMGPFNYPLNETFCTLIPAILMGNTVVFKPAKYGVLLLQPLLECFKEAFPPGVINTVYGDGSKVISPIMESGKIDVFAFIGSSHTANLITKKHPKLNRLRSVLGLNAKNPAIVLPDTDLKTMVPEILSGSLAYNGQRCTALKILFVHKDILDEFTKLYLEELAKWKAGMPWEEAVNFTPLPEEGKTNWLKELLDDALSKGSKILNPGGGAIHESFMFPAILSPVSPNARLYHEEQFGPLVPIVPFSTIDEPLDYIYASNMGQQASVFGKDAKTVGKLIDILVNQVARVNWNAQCQRGPDSFPFSGRKDSADGTLSVSDALRVFSIRTVVSFKDNEMGRNLLGEVLKERSSNYLSQEFHL
ncbi:NADP-dependent glyceraldehyde-3-phosphate dehydrogenase [Leptospira bandrabouensis]|uniref:NADP-dependent glyceraldehyde-3-phosphate dehydrogenase n=1 Tax=Leptospira bandrabouensis TaxID=2484903 RepID=UPI001EE8C2EB|nr:NADP-dependent glyceraldehyde-3-phosphate dehydrogenase [Leptospira bandrabouensis]MCG6143240.1 NADP-dependent glyceraldehyde-3-phosphate dehydrogenase [Leptospira bandrabouensis]MCG6158900.1 NADP-dependent glyceraldehyde-3-phosphate dehydrogenase [Leptospira bandrabouensis]MCG6162834.1 NADP-dependent glyceraldehyde-3-phosphate dehydrogenase [Leptospira bandrabouensis]